MSRDNRIDVDFAALTIKATEATKNRIQQSAAVIRDLVGMV